MPELKKWSIFVVSKSEFQAPELGVPHLQGEIFGDSRFPDGTHVNTSRLVGIADRGDFKKATTRSGTEYTLRENEVDPECEKQFPNYYQRLNLKGE